MTKTKRSQKAPDPHSAEFGAHVRSLRKARGLTQEKLAERSGLSADTIRRLEHGVFSPSLRTLRGLGAGLGLQLSTIFAAQECGEAPSCAARLRDFVGQMDKGEAELMLKVAELLAERG